MPVTYRVLGSWADVCALPDGRFVGVHSEMGKVVAQIIGGPVLWETVISTDILRYLRCSASSTGDVRAIGVGADDNAYVVGASGWASLGTVGGQNCVAIGWNGRAFVTFRTLYNPATKEIAAYARRATTAGLDGGEDVVLPTTIGHTSQGFREAIPGPSQTEDRIIWSDNLHFQFVAGRVLHKPSERNGVVVGQINGPDHIQGWNGAQFFHAIDGPAFEPHIAFNGSAYAIAARTGRGAAFIVVPPYPAVDAPPPPVVVPPVVVPPKEPPVSVPDQKPLVEEIRNALYPDKIGQPLNDRRKAFEITKHVAWRLKELGFGLVAAKEGSDNNVDGYTGDIVALKDGQHWDVLQDGEGAAFPAWGKVPDEHNAPIIPRWREPLPLGGDDDDPGDVDPPKPPDVPPATGDPTLAGILAEIQAVRAELRRIFR